MLERRRAHWQEPVRAATRERAQRPEGLRLQSTPETDCTTRATGSWTLPSHRIATPHPGRNTSALGAAWLDGLRFPGWRCPLLESDLDAVCRQLLRLKPIRFLQMQFAAHGDHFETILADGTRRVTTRSPEHTLKILVQRADDFGRIRNPIAPIVLEGLLISEGEVWKRRRSALQPQFRKGIVERLRPDLDSALDTYFANDFPLGEEPDFTRRCKELTLQGTVHTLFSPDAYEPALLEVLDTTMALTGAARIKGEVIDAPEVWKQTREQLTEHVEHILEAPNRRPFLAAMLNSGLSRDEVALELRSLLLGGQDTMSSVLMWATRLQSEHETPTRFDWVVEETLRLHTPLYAFPRRVVRQCDLGDVIVEPGDEVVSWPHVLHRDPRWWSDPESFRPERFAQRPAPGTFVPFSLGHHNCLGKHFARLFLVACVERLAGYTYRWHDRPPRCVPLMTMVPTSKVAVEIRLGDPS